MFSRQLAKLWIHAMAQGPWGGGDGGKGAPPSSDTGDNGDDKPAQEGPRNPWTQPGSGPKGTRQGGGNAPRPSMVEDLMRRGRESFDNLTGGDGSGGIPRGPDARALWPIALAIVLVLWLALTSFHRIGPQERGVVTMLGKYSRTLTPGISLTLPAPFEAVDVIDVEEIRAIDVGTVDGDDKNLMLTKDQNLIDLAYSVRWNIRNPEMYEFQIADPDTTIEEVAKSAMRSVIATVSLNEAIGAGRTMIEQQVQTEMQNILDSYRAGIKVQGIAIKQADPPAPVNDAFKEVSAAQQAAQTFVNEANAYAQQLSARAQGEAAAFEKVYEQYRLAPEVTRRRMYYETMEAVLPGVDKTIVETGNVMPYLPLPEMKKRAQAAQPAAAGGE
ncbi:MAG: FtsH protease activity modulator HflK [Sphingobium sp.]